MARTDVNKLIAPCGLYCGELALTIQSTENVMVGAVIVEHVLPPSIIRDVKSTIAVSNRKAMKRAENARNFPVQDSFNSATIPFGFIICQ